MDFEKQAQIIRQERDKQLSEHLIDITKYVEKIPKGKLQKIINSTATQLATMLNNNDTTSVQIINVFAQRAGTIGHQLVAMTEDNFNEALKMAQECDDKRKQTGWKNSENFQQKKQNFSSFFGIPISIKDTIDMKGFSSTIGCVARHQNKKQKDGQIVSIVKSAGMIPFIRSNVSQICLNYECNNLLWGKCQNPWNRQRTPGGSSGGEGALIASKCSPIGLGGDIGGSLRIPAEFCGLYTLKSTSNRITGGGHTVFSPSVDGQINIKATMGPLARCVQDLAAFLNILMDEDNYTKQTLDVYKKLIPFDSKIYKSISSNNDQKFRIGYYESFQLFPSTKASRRAVHEVINLLKQKGHIIIPVKIPRVQQITKVLVSILVAQGDLQGYQEILGGEPLSQEYNSTKLALSLPKPIHWIVCKVLQKFCSRMAFTLEECKQLSTHQYLCLSGKQKQLRQDFVKMWKNQNLDFIIGPGFGVQSPIIGQSYKMSILPAMYSNIWNVLDMTVGSLPVTTVGIDEQKYECSYDDSFSRSTHQNMLGTEGLPVGVQVISLPYYDQKVLGLMKLIQSEVKFHEKHHYPL